MEVYLLTKSDWIDFVNGKKVKALKESIEGCYKSILVGFIEIISEDHETVLIEKRY